MTRCSRILTVAAGAGLVALAGCATSDQVRVDFVSEPPGAMIYSGQTRIGVAPVTLRIDRPAEFASGGCTPSSAALTASWVSGAERRIESRLCAQQGMHQVFTFRRPIAEGAQADADYAVKMKSDALFERSGEAGANAVPESLTGWPPQPRR